VVHFSTVAIGCRVQVVSTSNDLLREDDYSVFVEKFAPAMNSIHDGVGKLILARLSLPDFDANSAAACGIAFT